MTLDPSFAHLYALSDSRGTFAHAAESDHRYRTEDAASVVLAVSRERTPPTVLVEVARASFRLLAEAQDVDGTVRTQRTSRGRWQGERHPGDAWGRSVWAFAVAAGSGPETWMRDAGVAHARRGLAVRSTSSRAMALAALGAADMVALDAHHRPAVTLLEDAVVLLGRPRADAAWPWPEDRLGAIDAVIPDALLAAGTALGRPDVVDDGLALLGWLVERQTAAGHLSPTPAGGAGPTDPVVGFDQRPADVAALAAACARAAAVTGERRWIDPLELAGRWFAGDNDLDVPVWDADTGGCADLLKRSGPSPDRGAEATLALISTLQSGRLVAAALG